MKYKNHIQGQANTGFTLQQVSQPGKLSHVKTAPSSAYTDTQKQNTVPTVNTLSLSPFTYERAALCLKQHT